MGRGPNRPILTTAQPAAVAFDVPEPIGIFTMLRSLDLSVADAARVRLAAPRLEPEVETWVTRFYERLQADPLTSGLLNDEALALRLRRALLAWWHEVFALPLDEDYARVRWAIGRTHVRLALPQHLMVTAMGGMQRDVAASVARLFADEPERGRDVGTALDKILDLELALMLQAYARELEDRRAHGNTKVPPLPAPPDAVRGPDSVHALAEIGRVTATFAHEIRNPLASLAGAIEMLRQDLEPSDRAEVIEQAAQRLAHMGRLLDDVLRLARPLRGPSAPLDLAEIARSALDMARTDAAFSRIAIEILAPRTPVLVVAHLEPLQQAVQNLLLNAVQAQPGDGAIRVRIGADGDFATLDVEDDGPGIPSEKREVVFEPFWTTKPNGTGLGLPYVRRVAEAAGGTATVTEASRGTVVRVRLPREGR